MNTKESVILAAGLSSRFNFDDCSFNKFLLPLKKSIILNYVIAAMRVAGIKKINIVVDEKVDKSNIISCCYEFGEELNIEFKDLKLNLIENKFPERENGYSLFLGISEVSSDNFILSMADHVFSENLYSKLIERYENEDIVLATDPMETEGIYDLEDCTKVFGKSKSIKKIGKQIENYNRLDMGVFLMNTITIRKIAQDVEQKFESFGVSDIIISAIDSNLEVNYSDFPKIIWVDVDNEIEYKKVIKNFDQTDSIRPFNLDLNTQ